MGILKELQKELKKPTGDAVNKLVEDFGQDAKFIQKALSEALRDMGKCILAGDSVEQAVANLDTETTFLLAGALADAGKHQAKMLKAAKGILDQLGKLLLKKIAVAIL